MILIEIIYINKLIQKSIYSKNQIELTKPMATKNAKYLNNLNLEILNSSTITSIVDIYKNVPAEIE